MRHGKNIENIGRWASDEQKLFLAAVKMYGKDWKKVAKLVGTRTANQVRSHAQKLQSQLDLPKTRAVKIIRKVDSSTQYGEGILFTGIVLGL